MVTHNRKELPKLDVLATPIGHLGDLSDRAKQVLTDADIIYCEDTRRTRVLLEVLGLKKTLIRCDEEVETQLVEKIRFQLVEEQKRCVLVSDAGAPSLADPGSRLIRLLLEQGVSCSPIPGPSALTALVSVAGLKSKNILFKGFYPRQEKQQEKIFEEWLRSDSTAFVFFESPERIVKSLKKMTALLESHSESKYKHQLIQTWFVVGKEMTKLHEQFFCGDLFLVEQKVSEWIKKEGALGEWCFVMECEVVDSMLKPEGHVYHSVESVGHGVSWEEVLKLLLKHQAPLSQAVKDISQLFGVPKNVVYESGLRFKKD